MKTGLSSCSHGGSRSSAIITGRNDTVAGPSKSATERERARKEVERFMSNPQIPAGAHRVVGSSCWEG